MFVGLTEMRRAKLRFALCASAIGILVFLILFQGALASSLLNSFTGGLEVQRGNALIYSSDARKDLSASEITPSQLAAIAQVQGVEESGPLGQSVFSVTAGGELQEANLFGYELGGPGEPTSVSEGRLPSGPFEAVASAADVDKGFGLGETIRLEPGGTELTVVGLVDDAQFFVAPSLSLAYSDFVRVMKERNPSLQEVLPQAVAADITGDALGRIENDVAGVEALSRQQAVDEYPGVSSVTGSFSIIIGLGFLIVVLVVGFFFLILTAQKSASLTLLRAIGAPVGYLLRNLAIQVVLVTGVGIGIAITLVLLAQQLGGDAIGVDLDPAALARSSASVFVLALVAAFFSARRVLRIDPAQALNQGAIR